MSKQGAKRPVIHAPKVNRPKVHTPKVKRPTAPKRHK